MPFLPSASQVPPTRTSSTLPGSVFSPSNRASAWAPPIAKAIVRIARMDRIYIGALQPTIISFPEGGSDVQIVGELGALLDELEPQLRLVAHQRIDGGGRLLALGDGDAEER